MDQPTKLEITIKGKELDIKRAALVAQRRIDLPTRGFKESNYEFGDGSDFESKMDGTLGKLGHYTISLKDDVVEFTSEQESYGCTDESDVRNIAEDIVKATPAVEVHISATITVNAAEGYDIGVEIDYANGDMKVDVSEDKYASDNWVDDFVKKIPLHEFLSTFSITGEDFDEELYRELVLEMSYDFSDNPYEMELDDFSGYLDAYELETDLEADEFSKILKAKFTEKGIVSSDDLFFGDGEFDDDEFEDDENE